MKNNFSMLMFVSLFFFGFTFQALPKAKDEVHHKISGRDYFFKRLDHLRGKREKAPSLKDKRKSKSYKSHQTWKTGKTVHKKEKVSFKKRTSKIRATSIKKVSKKRRTLFGYISNMPGSEK